MARATKAPRKEGRTRTRKKGGRGKPRPLRGEKLVRAAHALMAEWANFPPETHPINVLRLAVELGITRQAVYNNKLEAEVENYRKLQRENYKLKSEQEAVNKPHEEIIRAKDEEIADLRRKLDGWIERWAAVEYNAKMHGIDADKIFTPLPRPDREQADFGRGGRGEGDDDE